MRAGGIKELAGVTLVALENTPDTHHLVVCTLCSCYPLGILGLSPSWYSHSTPPDRLLLLFDYSGLGMCQLSKLQGLLLLLDSSMLAM